jgi:hypothetical protein
MTFVALIVLSLTATVVIGVPLVKLPEDYTAMKGDIVVSFNLANDNDSNSTNLKSFNAMIHLEYLPGDSVLTNHHHTSSAIHLARYILKF